MKFKVTKNTNDTNKELSNDNGNDNKTNEELKIPDDPLFFENSIDVPFLSLSENNFFSNTFLSSHDNLGEYMAERVIQNNNLNNKGINDETSKDILATNNKEIKPNNNLFKVYKKKEHTKYNRDNITDKVIRNSFNNIIEPCNEEITKMKNCNFFVFNDKLFKKINNIIVFFPKIKLEKMFKLKIKNILCDDISKNKNLIKKEIPEKYMKKKNDKNLNNKMLIKKIEEIKENIEEIKDETIKKCILILNEILNTSLYDMYKIYLTNDKRYESFKTIIDDMISLDKNGEDKNYLEKYENVAQSLLIKIDDKEEYKILY